jgi:dihydrodipicolinate synthase/N-acetylneuraminate lyase
VARRGDLRFDREANRKLIQHLEAGGVKTLLYGGNANLYHVRVSEYAGLLALLLEAASDETLVIPSVGPAYGVMMDQARVLLDFQSPTAMILPPQGVSTPEGVETGIRHFVEALGRPALLYLKQQDAISVEGIRRLSDDGLLSGVKYSIVRDNPAEDEFLRQLTDIVDPRSIVSGMGEQPAIVHMRDFQLGGFTSGCVCIAPRLSTNMLLAVKRGDFEAAEQIRAKFQPLEDLRNSIHPVRVLHDAVGLCDIAETGPVLPLLSNLNDDQRHQVGEVAKRLLQLNA